MKSDPLALQPNLEARPHSADFASFNASSNAPDFSSSLLNPPCNRTGLDKLVNGADLPHNSTSNGGEIGLPSSASDTNLAILISLIVLIVLLLLILAYLVGPTIIWFVRRRIPVDPKKLDARYETIEGWLISKVRQVDAFFRSKVIVGMRVF
jgi:hypothetical protein